METLIQSLMTSGKTQDVYNLMVFCTKNKYYSLGILFGEMYSTFFNYSIELLDELAICYYYAGFYKNSWRVYTDILSASFLNETQIEKLFFNSHFNIPFIEGNFVDYPLTKIKEISYNIQPTPLVTFSITTCKRFDLFEKTMNSFLNCCEDLFLISHWICVDDNSSVDDRRKMKEKYPFFQFFFKTEEQKGHANSMNIIVSNLQTPYVFHIEDDWMFYYPKPYISQCLDVLNSDEKYGQCLLNKNYAETSSDVSIKGGIFKKTKNNVIFFEHEHKLQDTREGYGASYWPHYSLRPSMLKSSIFVKTGGYHINAEHFEREFANRYTTAGFVSTFLPGMSCKHIGKLTSETAKDKPNAYTLNGESQFSSNKKSSSSEIVSLEPFVVNLNKRKDRYETFLKNCPIALQRYEAIDGMKLKSTRDLEMLFNDNDYNYNRGAIGCALSHIDLWTNLSKKSGVYLILEDDITFVDGFIESLKEELNEICQKDKEWDIIFIGHHSRTKENVRITGKTTREQSFKNSYGGTFGYIINTKGALGMLKFIQETGMTNAIDTMMQNAADILRIYYTKPLVFSECFGKDTDIQTKGDQSLKVDKLSRLQNEKDLFEKYGHAFNVIEAGGFANNSDIIAICKNCQCSSTTSFNYKVEDVVIHIPGNFAGMYISNYRLLCRGEFSTSQLIQFES